MGKAIACKLEGLADIQELLSAASTEDNSKEPQLPEQREKA